MPQRVMTMLRHPVTVSNPMGIPTVDSTQRMADPTSIATENTIGRKSFGQRIPVSEPKASAGTPLAPVPAAPKKLSVNRETINSVAEDCIERLADSHQYVSLERIEKLVLQQYCAASLHQLNMRRLDDLPCVNNHIRMECKVG